MTNIDCSSLGADELKYLLSLSISDQLKAVEIGIMALSYAGVRPTSHTSSRIGAAGEDTIAGIIETHFKVLNVSRVAQSCDLLILYKGKRVLVEVKNYSTAVGQPQVDKFIRDIGLNSACGGVFISMNTPIRGISSKFYVCNEHTDGRLIPTVYIQGVNPDMILSAVNLAGDLADVNIERRNPSDDIVRRNLDRAVDSLERVSHTRGAISTYLSEIVSGSHKHISNMIIAESTIRDCLHELRDDLYKYETCAEECPVSSIGIKPSIYEYVSDVACKLRGKWSRTKNKYICDCGAGFIIEKDRVWFYINRSNVTRADILNLIDIADISSTQISIQVNGDSIGHIRSLARILY